MVIDLAPKLRQYLISGPKVMGRHTLSPNQRAPTFKMQRTSSCTCVWEGAQELGEHIDARRGGGDVFMLAVCTR